MLADSTCQQLLFALALLFDRVKMRCNKLQSIWSCEFWQKLNKMEADRYNEGAKHDVSPLNPLYCCWTRRLLAICHPIHTSRGVQSQRRAGTHSLPVTVTPSTAHLLHQGVRMHAATCICIVESASLREDSECHTRHMQSIREHRNKQTNKKKTRERKQNKPAHLKQKENHSATLVEKKRCNPGGQKRCQIDHACAVQPVPGIKEEKLIFFFKAKFSVVKDDSHRLPA